MPVETSSMLLAGGRILDPANGLDATGDVLVQNGRIAAVETTPWESSSVAPPLLGVTMSISAPKLE